MEKLRSAFDVVNDLHFDAFLEAPILRWNSRLRSSAGRFIPGARPGVRTLFRRAPPAIEVASYLLEEAGADSLIRDTVAHEMIHYWLWVRRRPYGHTPEFWTKMKQMGVSRYNPVPRTRPYRYLYRCVHCLGEFPARKRLGPLACAKCCRAHADGRFDARFKLELLRKIGSTALVGLLAFGALGAGLTCGSPYALADASGGKKAAVSTTWVMKPDGGESCAPGEENKSLELGAKELKSLKIRVLDLRKGDDGKMHVQMCGAPTGATNLYLIPRKDLSRAIAAGYTETPASR